MQNKMLNDTHNHTFSIVSELLADYVRREDLKACVLTCRTWNVYFTPRLWSCITFPRPTIPTDVRVKFITIPTADSIKLCMCDECHADFDRCEDVPSDYLAARDLYQEHPYCHEYDEDDDSDDEEDYLDDTDEYDFTEDDRAWTGITSKSATVSEQAPETKAIPGRACENKVIRGEDCQLAANIFANLLNKLTSPRPWTPALAAQLSHDCLNLFIRDIDFSDLCSDRNISIPIISVLRGTLGGCPNLRTLNVGCAWKLQSGEASMESALKGLNIVCWRTLRTFSIHQSDQVALETRQHPLCLRATAVAMRRLQSQVLDMGEIVWPRIISQMPHLTNLDLRRFGFMSFSPALIEAVTRSCPKIAVLRLGYGNPLSLRTMLGPVSALATHLIGQLMALRRETLIEMDIPAFPFQMTNAVSVSLGDVGTVPTTVTIQDIKKLVDDLEIPVLRKHSGIVHLSRNYLVDFASDEVYLDHLRHNGRNPLQKLTISGVQISPEQLEMLVGATPLFPMLSHLDIVTTDLPKQALLDLPTNLATNLPKIKILGLDGHCAADFNMLHLSQCQKLCADLETIHLRNMDDEEPISFHWDECREELPRHPARLETLNVRQTYTFRSMIPATVLV